MKAETMKAKMLPVSVFSFIFNPDPQLNLASARAMGEPGSSEDTRSYSFEVIFALFAVELYRVFGRAQPPLIDVRSEAESVGFATTGLLLASASGPTVESGVQF